MADREVLTYSRRNGFYLFNHLKSTPHGTDALIMYVGALIWAASAGIAFLRALYTFTPIGAIVRAAVVSAGKFLERWSVILAFYTFIALLCLFMAAAALIWLIGFILWCWICLPSWQWSRRRRVNFRMPPFNKALGRGLELLPALPKKYRKDGQKTGSKKPWLRRIFNWLWPWSQERRRKRKDRAREAAFPGMSEKQRVEEYILHMGLRPKLMDELLILVLSLLVPWMSQWIFWVGFVRLAEEMYCPPDIWTLTTVRSVCSIFAVWFGVAY